MQKTIDISELTEEQKAALLVKYLRDLSTAYDLRAGRTKENPDDLLPDLRSTLVEKSQEVYKLSMWIDAILQQRAAKKLGEQMNQQMQMQVEANKPKVEMDGFDVGKLFDHISAAKAQTKKTLELMKRGNKTDGEKRCLEMLFAFETVDNILMRISGGTR